MTHPLGERRQIVARMTRTGHSAEQIATRLGVTSRTVTRDRKALGIAQPAATPLTDTEHAHAKRLLADGCSPEEVGRTLGRHPDVIRHHYPEHKWTPQQIVDHAILVRNARKVLA